MKAVCRCVGILWSSSERARLTLDDILAGALEITEAFGPRTGTGALPLDQLE